MVYKTDFQQFIKLSGKLSTAICDHHSYRNGTTLSLKILEQWWQRTYLLWG
jgi:hypothetical protein